MLRHAQHDTVVTLSVPKGDQRSWFGKLTMTRAVRVTLLVPPNAGSVPKGDHYSWFGKLTMTRSVVVTLSLPVR